jgi:ribosomal protein S18 acetylase RimI-like enzyme
MSESHFEIRTLSYPTEEDIAAIGDMAEDSFIRFGHYREFISSLVTEDGVITGVLIDNTQDEKIAGFLLLGFHLTTEYYLADILAIALDPDYRGKKLGTRLMGWCLDILNKMSEKKLVKEVKLTVARDNKAAVHLFKNFGFAFDPANIGEYSSGVPASYMRRKVGTFQ